MKYDLYTPDQWFSAFKDPSIGIEADGTIRYLRSDLNLYPLASGGRIDFSSSPKLIYDSTGNAIAAITEESNGTQRVCTYSYGRLGEPIYFIIDRQVYSWDQYFSAVKDPIAFIQIDPYGSGSSSGGVAHSSMTYKQMRGMQFAFHAVIWGVGLLLSFATGMALPLCLIFGIYLAVFVVKNANKLFDLLPGNDTTRTVIAIAIIIVCMLIMKVLG